MIIAVAGEFLDVRWTEDGALVAVDMDGAERVRMTWTGWPVPMRQRTKAEIAWDITSVLIFARLHLANGEHRLNDSRRTWALATAEPLFDRVADSRLGDG